MSEMSISVTPEELVLSVLRDLGNGQVEDATGYFADQFRFKDHGIGDRVIMEWTLQAILMEPSMADSNGEFPSRCMGPPSCARRTARLQTGWSKPVKIAKPGRCRHWAGST